MSHPFTPSDLAEQQQSLVVWRGLLESLVDAHRSGAPVALIGDLNEALKTAFLVPDNHKAHWAAASAADALNARYRDTHPGVVAFRGELYQLAAHRSLKWDGPAEGRAYYLKQFGRTQHATVSRSPISADDRFITTLNFVMADVAYGCGMPTHPVVRADASLRLALESAKHDAIEWRLWELRALVAEVAGFRFARSGSERGSEKRTQSWRNRASESYREAEGLAEADDRERVKLRHSNGNHEPRSRSNPSAHLQPHGSVAWFLDTTAYSADLLEAIDLAQIRGAFGNLNKQGGGYCFDCSPSGPDLLLGLFLVDGGQAQAILAGLGVHEVQLREAVEEVKRDVPRNITPGTILHALHAASDRAAMSDRTLAGSEHLLHALASSSRQTPAKQVLAKLDITPEHIKQGVDDASPRSRGPVATL
jgi:hypothetical protein